MCYYSGSPSPLSRQCGLRLPVLPTAPVCALVCGCAPASPHHLPINSPRLLFYFDRIAICTKTQEQNNLKSNSSGADLPLIGAAAITILCQIYTNHLKGRIMKRMYQSPEIRAAPARVTNVSMPALVSQDNTLRSFSLHISYPRMMFLVSRMRPTQNASNSMVRTTWATPSHGDKSISISWSTTGGA